MSTLMKTNVSRTFYVLVMVCPVDGSFRYWHRAGHWIRDIKAACIYSSFGSALNKMDSERWRNPKQVLSVHSIHINQEIKVNV